MTTVAFLGTDTEIGKTRVVSSFAAHLYQTADRVITQKWIQTGSDRDISIHDQHRINQSIAPMKDRVPFTFEKPASPHLADQEQEIAFEPIRESLNRLQDTHDWVLIEGTGGIFVPVTHQVLYIDWVKALDIPVVLVVGNRIGAINHSLLTIEALKNRSITCLGLVFNQSVPDQDEQVLSDNQDIISRLSGLENFGSFEYGQDILEFDWESCKRACLK